MFDIARLRLTLVLLITLALAAIWMPGARAQQDPQPEQGTGRTAKASVAAADYMIAAANPHAVEAGYQVLKAGGTAVDAMIATQLMLNLVEPQSSGIGGGAFMLYWDAAAGTLQTFDGRETAPAAATPAYFLTPEGEPMKFWDAVIGGRSVGVPGTLRLIDVAHKMHGRMPWAELIQPAIDLAEAGFEVSPRMAESIVSSQKRDLDKFAAARGYFFNDDGTPLAAGTRLKNPELAATFRLIAAQGADVFYRGEIAADIVAAVRATTDNPSVMTLADLAGYQVKLRAPVCQPYRAYRVCGMGPPTSGGLTVGQMLGVLGHFDLPGMGLTADSVHLFAEAGKLAYADRGLYMADADFVSVPVKGLLDPAYLTARAQLVKLDAAVEKASAGNPPWRETRLWAPDQDARMPGTSHLVIRDRYGNALSMTTTIETGFGSRVMVRGFLLNNELTDFSRAPERDGRPIANRVEAGKRPRSSMAPTIVFKGDSPYLLVGSPGGSRIINYVAKTIVAVLDWDMDVQEAIGLGHFVNRNGATDLEQGTDAVGFQEALEARGHKVNARDLNSGLHAILIRDGTLTGGADPRREGIVMGD